MDMINNRGMFTSKTDLWATPQYFFEKLNFEFKFDLDVCADETNHKCAEYFTAAQDGLKQDWSGRRCWMNPPYGREIGKWVEKAYRSGTLVVALLPSRTDTKWFHNFVLNKAEIRFVPGRLKFGGASNSAPFPSLVAIWGQHKFGLLKP